MIDDITSHDIFNFPKEFSVGGKERRAERRGQGEHIRKLAFLRPRTSCSELYVYVYIYIYIHTYIYIYIYIYIQLAKMLHRPAPCAKENRKRSGHESSSLDTKQVRLHHLSPPIPFTPPRMLGHPCRQAFLHVRVKIVYTSRFVRVILARGPC